MINKELLANARLEVVEDIHSKDIREMMFPNDSEDDIEEYAESRIR